MPVQCMPLSREFKVQTIFVKVSCTRKVSFSRGILYFSFEGLKGSEIIFYFLIVVIINNLVGVAF